ncbi:hypothetical protein [Endozoicomonas sp. YOMI1]|uniref:hypothetical protein n=1 Tax=Endozoicomonas sp. YOMI1 TaxID=2828739 RepID=UPI002147B7FE|nr:hypothetical protein [Endozoicomonas sp. YOMI1]
MVKNIFVVSGGYEYIPDKSCNLGDVAQLLHALDTLKENYPNSVVKLLSHSINDSNKFTCLKMAKGLSEYLHRKKKGKLPIGFYVIKLIICAILMRFGLLAIFLKEERVVLKEFSEQDLVFFAGAGVFHDGYINGVASFVFNCNYIKNTKSPRCDVWTTNRPCKKGNQ